MGLFLEIKIRQDGKEKWVDASKFLKYMLKEHLQEEASKGGVLPYPDEENKQQIFEMWWNLYDKKRSKKLGKGPINLIHREDCIRIIQTIIDFESWGELFNGVSPYHPSKDEYYNFVCDYFGLSHLEFVESEEGKKVDSVNLERKLKYKFVHRDLEPGLFKFL